MNLSSPTTDAPLLATKLFAPRLRDRMVHRQRLTALLEQAPGAILVSAPAGFGKSTILADWLRQRKISAAWLSLEPADSEPRRFLRYLAGALSQLAPRLGGSIESCLQAPALPSPEAILLPSLNELSRLECDTALILDDYHTIDDPTVHALVEYWIEHQPPRFHLVLSTRVDPPFSLSRWRGQDSLTELRAPDLRFSADESASFLRQVMDLDLPEHLNQALQQRTEGWIVGLQMAALSMRGQGDVAAFVEAFTGSHRFILDYLTEEALARQPEDVLDFLLQISLLERFSAPLCDAMLERDDSQHLLARLEVENLFVIPLDSERRWFRFHHLFRQLLERQLPLRVREPSILRWRQRACDWLAAQGFPDEALDQALAAQDESRAIGVLELHVETVLQQGDAAAAMRWFDRVPLPWVEARPKLAIMRALALFLAVRWTELEDWSAWLQELLSRPLEDRLGGQALTLAACFATARADREAAIGSARQALELLSPDDHLLRSIAAISLGSSLLLASDYPAAEAAFSDAASWSAEGHDPLGLATTCDYYQGRLDLVRGRTREAFERHQRAWARHRSPQHPHPMSSLPLVGQAEVCFEWGELNRAADLAREAIAVNRGCFPFNELRARLILIDVARAQRDFDTAIAASEILREMLQPAALKQWEAQVPIHHIRTLALKTTTSGHPAAESEWKAWAQTYGLAEGDDLESKLLMDEPQTAAVTLSIRWLLWNGETATGLGWIGELRSLAETRDWQRAIIESWLLEALACRADEPVRAAEAFGRACQLAESGQFVQVLADESEWLRDLPREDRAAALGGVSEDFRRRVMQALDGAGADDRPCSKELAEPLSSRELEVLTAVAAGGTNAAVGQALFISPRTVKKHLENIYGKLEVHNRLEAVQRARALGLLPSDAPSEAVAKLTKSSPPTP